MGCEVAEIVNEASIILEKISHGGGHTEMAVYGGFGRRVRYPRENREIERVGFLLQMEVLS